jgi:hypothetical protein
MDKSDGHAAFAHSTRRSFDGVMARGDVKTNRAGRASLDQFADFVTVARTCFDQRRNEPLGATLFPCRL